MLSCLIISLQSVTSNRQLFICLGFFSPPGLEISPMPSQAARSCSGDVQVSPLLWWGLWEKTSPSCRKNHTTTSDREMCQRRPNLRAGPVGVWGFRASVLACSNTVGQSTEKQPSTGMEIPTGASLQTEHGTADPERYQCCWQIFQQHQLQRRK